MVGVVTVLRILGVAAVAFLLDRLTKSWIVESFSLHESRPVWPGVISITYVENTGAAFSLLTQHTQLLSIASVVVILMVLWLAWHSRSPLVRLALGLVLGGAFGNLSDRVLRGAVVDFIDLHFWPVFNVADMAIVCGVLLLAYVWLFRGEAGLS